MKTKDVAAKLRAAAAYIEETRAPAKEREIIERILSTGAALRGLANEIEKEAEADDTDDQ